jgi:serine/threonine-protein kinase
MRRAGERVSQHVRLLEPLGGGAMGSVWVAEHLTLETTVAVKFIHARFGRDPELFERFAGEAKAAARIKSPHVVQMLDHGIMEDGTPYMVMELLEGQSLAGCLEREGWLAYDDIARIITQVSRALVKAHERGIVHRDIKPENIFLSPSEDGPFVKLLDFGVAKFLAMPTRKETHPGAVIGTAEYLSPEQVISTRLVDHRADVWAMAVVAYEMLTGDVPFTGETLGAVCTAIVRGSFTPPSELRRGCPTAVDEVFARAFERELPKRYASARDFAAAFRVGLLGDADSSGRFSTVPAREFNSLPSIPTALTTTPGVGPRPTPASLATLDSPAPRPSMDPWIPASAPPQPSTPPVGTRGMLDSLDAGWTPPPFDRAALRPSDDGTLAPLASRAVLLPAPAPREGQPSYRDTGGGAGDLPLPRRQLDALPFWRAPSNLPAPLSALPLERRSRAWLFIALGLTLVLLVTFATQHQRAAAARVVSLAPFVVVVAARAIERATAAQASTTPPVERVPHVAEAPESATAASRDPQTSRARARQPRPSTGSAPVDTFSSSPPETTAEARPPTWQEGRSDYGF